MSPVLKGLASHLRACFVTSWKTTVVGLLVAVAAETLNYLGTVTLPPWAHALVALASAALVFYKGQAQLPVPQPEPVKVPETGSEAAKVALK